jgi:uncharacterized protein (DUF4213/DUF364 family)
MSRLAEELVELARRIADELRPPAVARVLVPSPDLGPEQHGSFCAVQLADGGTGLAYVLLGDARRRLQSVPAADPADHDALSLAQGFLGRDPAARALGLAAINALSRHALDRAGFAPDFATSSLGSLALGRGDRLGMVGFFPPLVRRARAEGIPLTVLELKAELVQEAPGLTVTLDPARLAECSKIVCTSTVLLNDALDGLLAHARGCGEFVVIGPSAGCVPDALFARGVTAVGGAWVSDPRALLERGGERRYDDFGRPSHVGPAVEVVRCNVAVARATVHAVRARTDAPVEEQDMSSRCADRFRDIAEAMGIDPRGMTTGGRPGRRTTSPTQGGHAWPPRFPGDRAPIRRAAAHDVLNRLTLLIRRTELTQ